MTADAGVSLQQPFLGTFSHLAQVQVCLHIEGLCIDCANPQITILHKWQALGSSVSLLLDERHVIIQDYLETGRCDHGCRNEICMFFFNVLSKYGSPQLTITAFSLSSPN